MDLCWCQGERRFGQCVRVGFQERSIQTWKVIIDLIQLRAIPSLLHGNLNLSFESATLTGAAVIN